MKVLKSEKQYKNKIGDILFGKEYLEEINIKELEKKRYCYDVSVNRLPKELQNELKKYFQYECPFIVGNRYLWFTPSFVFTDTPDKQEIMHQFQKTLKDKKMYGWFSDQIKAIEEFDEYRNNDTFGSEGLYMGHGYTDCTLPYDGSNHKDVCMIRVDNGDILVGQTWVWFNK